MSPDRFRQLLDRCSFPSQGDAARFLGIEDRMFRRMATGQQAVPHSVALVLEIMAAYSIMPGDLESWKFED
jgi:hypothetical protein